MENDLLEHFEHYLNDNNSPTSVKGYLSDIRAFIGWAKGHKGIELNRSLLKGQPHLLNKAVIDAYLKHLHAEKYALNTIARHGAAMRVFGTFLLSSGIVPVNPAEKIKNVKPDPSDPRGLDDDQRAKLEYVFRTPWERTANKTSRRREKTLAPKMLIRDKKHQPGFWQRTFSHRAVWVTVAAVLVVAIVTYFGLQTLGPPSQPSGGGIVQPPPAGSQVTTAVPPAVTTSAPSAAPPAVPTREPPTQFIVAANPNGNFVFLVSDEVNAIADFSSLNLVVEKIGLLQSGTSEKWLEFTPQVKEFDLSLLPGDKSLELWRGDIPAGQYNRVFIQVSQVTGVLKSTGKTLDIKLPSNKLQMSLNFEVSADSVTHFTYDLTVVNAGNGKNGGKYLLKPQITESGAKQIKK